MTFPSYTKLIGALLFVGISHITFAQTKARVYIKKDQNGTITEETREFNLSEGQDVETVLKEMGILDEFGQLKEGQQFSINIEKSDVMEGDQNMQLRFSPIYPPVPPMPPMPPMPTVPMEPQAFLGVMIKDFNEGNDTKKVDPRVIITEIVPGSAAETAGLQAGDIILKIDKQEIHTFDDVVNNIKSHNPGDEVKVEYLREGKKKSLKTALGAKEPEPFMQFNNEMPPVPFDNFLRDFEFNIDADSITIPCPDARISPCDSLRICQPFSWKQEGFELQQTAFLGVTPGEENGEPGALIETVIEGSAAQEMELQPGDIVLSIDGVIVNEFNDLADYIKKAQPHQEVTIVIIRDNKQKEIKGQLGSREVSGKDDFRIFHDFKGMDEDGQYFYDYEFDVNEEDLELQMEKLLEQLSQQEQQIDEQQQAIEERLQRLRENRESIEIVIEIADISKEEADQVNKKASPKLSTSNDLNLDRISFFPNPSAGLVNLNFTTTQTGEITISLFDGNGSTLFFEQLKNFSGEYNNQIDLNNQPNGTYYLQILQNGKAYSKKLVKGE